MKAKITEKHISNFIRFLCVLALLVTILVTKSDNIISDMIFDGVGIIVSIIAILFSPKYPLNKLVFNYLKNHQNNRTHN